MSHISVCKNVISSNNKRGWNNPDPPIRLSNTRSGKVSGRGHRVAIKDAKGNIVAEIISTKDGTPVIKCGAKVGIVTKYPAEVLE